MKSKKFAILTTDRKFKKPVESLKPYLEKYLKEAEKIGVTVIKVVFGYSTFERGKNPGYELMWLCHDIIQQNKLPIRLVMCVGEGPRLSRDQRRSLREAKIKVEVSKIYYFYAAKEDEIIRDASLLLCVLPLQSMERFRMVKAARQYNIPVRNLMMTFLPEQKLKLDGEALKEYDETIVLIDRIINESYSNQEIQTKRDLLIMKINRLLDYARQTAQVNKFLKSD